MRVHGEAVKAIQDYIVEAENAVISSFFTVQRFNASTLQPNP
jgi:hypothetical protein